MTRRITVPAGLALMLCFAGPLSAQDNRLAPPSDLTAADEHLDGGQTLTVTFKLSTDDQPGENNPVARYELQISQQRHGKFTSLSPAIPTPADYQRGGMEVVVPKLTENEAYFFRVYAVGPTVEGATARSAPVETTEAAIPRSDWFFAKKAGLLAVLLTLCAAVVTFIGLARSGRPLKIRKIAGLEAVDEAVGRATEMGRSCLFVPGIQDMNDIQTVSGLTVLSHVSKTAAEYDAKVEVPTCRALVMAAARETVQASFLSAGRPDSFNEDLVYYVTDEQFGYVAYLSGMMVREKPAACFYMGSFYAESLILAETGNSIGAIQVAGTAQPSQLPFFVAACDYTLIGEEFFAASAYLSGDPDQLGSLKGQDVGKALVAVLLIVGCLLLTGASVTGTEWMQTAGDFLKNTVLGQG